MQKSSKLIQPTSPDQAANASYTPLAYDKGLSDTDRFIVCGLGNLGQRCVINLKSFASKDCPITITAIDKDQPTTLEAVNLSSLLAQDLIIGDSRQEGILEKAGIRRCRSILLLSGDENANIEAAFAARRLNPLVRLVVRSSRSSLNRLLEQQLDNCVALDAAELPATAFVVAGLGDGTIGAFSIGEHQFRVAERRVKSREARFEGLPAYSVGRTPYRLLTLNHSAPSDASHQPGTKDTGTFYRWRPDAIVKAGDWITYVEVIEPNNTAALKASTYPNNPLKQLGRTFRSFIQFQWWRKINNGWQWIQEKQIRQMVFTGLVTAFCLELGGAVLLKYGMELSWHEAAFSSVILLLGGYGDLFGGTNGVSVPWWVELFSLLITIVSILVVLGTLGLVADHILSTRFEFLQKRHPVPHKDHVVVVGLGRVGSKVATLLQELKQPLVALTSHQNKRDLFPHIPVLTGDILRDLRKVNLAQAKSIIALTDDQILNLEIALIASDKAKDVGRKVGSVIRANDQRFSDNLVNLLPNATAFCPDELSAQAYAGAAFGERILGLFALHDQIILVVEFHITEDDTLVGKLLSELAYGYGVVPILYQTDSRRLDGRPIKVLIPSDIERLKAGDHLVVLSSIDGLRKIERGDIAPPWRWRLEVRPPTNQILTDAAARNLTDNAAHTLHIISGCDLSRARAFMGALPGKIELPLYKHQAYSLWQALRRCGLPSAELKQLTK
ncbi:MAG: NAD-binding protein [Pseudanabaenales cyanobacterium]|nr:NAD-binding protein [Pseudanabaenales cyanobacterium]